MRNKILDGNLDQYMCCQGYYDCACFKAGSIGDQGNPCCTPPARHESTPRRRRGSSAEMALGAAATTRIVRKDGSSEAGCFGAYDRRRIKRRVPHRRPGLRGVLLPRRGGRVDADVRHGQV